MLQRRDIHQVTAQQNATMLFQPLARIPKDKMVLATNMFVAQSSNLLRCCKEVKICVNCYSFHFLSNSAS